MARYDNWLRQFFNEGMARDRASNIERLSSLTEAFAAAQEQIPASQRGVLY